MAGARPTSDTGRWFLSNRTHKRIDIFKKKGETIPQAIERVTSSHGNTPDDVKREER